MIEGQRFSLWELKKGDSMFKCPHCHHKSITFFQKFNLILDSKNRDHRCRDCGGLVAVSFVLIMLLLPVIAIPLVFICNYESLLGSDFIAVLIIFFGTISAITFLVPLKKLIQHTKR